MRPTWRLVQAELGVGPGGAVGGPAALMGHLDLLSERPISSGTRRRRPARQAYKPTRDTSSTAAQQVDGMVRLLLVDQPEDHGR
jgi:hypothetical protein